MWRPKLTLKTWFMASAFFFFFSFIFWPHLRHMEAPGPQVQSELQLLTTLQLQQCWILNLLSWAGD